MPGRDAPIQDDKETHSDDDDSSYLNYASPQFGQHRRVEEDDEEMGEAETLRTCGLAFFSSTVSREKQQQQQQQQQL